MFAPPPDEECPSGERCKEHPVGCGDAGLLHAERREDLDRDRPRLERVKDDRADEVAERGQERERSAGRKCRAQHRQRDAPKSRPSPGAEGGTRLVERRIELAQAGERGSAGERQIPHQVGQRTDPGRADEGVIGVVLGLWYFPAKKAAWVTREPGNARAGVSALGGAMVGLMGRSP